MPRLQPYVRFTVRRDGPLLDFIEASLAGISHSRAKAILTGGGVRVDHAVVTRFDFSLRAGQLVEVRRRKPKDELVSKYVRIVYEDTDIVVVEKAIGILSMASPGQSFCVKSILDDYFRRSHQRCTAHVVHRLDRDTSGLLVYAKTLRAEQTLEHNWRDIVTDRRYVALVSGVPSPKQGTLRSYLKDNAAYVTYSSATDNGGKLAVTHYEVKREDGRHALVDLKLETGRKNQIRVHMKDIGTPVCGDIKYGNGDDPAGRLALHAFRLDFYHPRTGEPLHFETPVPKTFLRAFGRRQGL